MSSPLKFRWKKSPRNLAAKVERYGKDILVDVYAVAAQWGTSVQNAARKGVRWEDRTGNARGGLFFAVDGFGLAPLIGKVKPEANSFKTDKATVSGNKHRLIVTLGHTVFYGKFLELNGRYAIVMSTIESNLGRLEAMLRRILQ